MMSKSVMHIMHDVQSFIFEGHLKCVNMITCLHVLYAICSGVFSSWLMSDESYLPVGFPHDLWVMSNWQDPLHC